MTAGKKLKWCQVKSAIKLLYNLLPRPLGAREQKYLYSFNYINSVLCQSMARVIPKAKYIYIYICYVILKIVR